MEIKGIDREKVKIISDVKKEDSWIRDFRLDSYEKFEKIGMPEFGPKIDLDFSEIIYYKSNKQDDDIKNNWNNVLKPVVDELDSLGVLESEKHLGGMGVQYESEVIYHSMLEELEKKKVIFTSIEMAMKKYPELVEKYFGREIEANFKLTNYIMLWRNPEEYKDRVNLLKENQDFTEKEIDDILSLFNEYKKSDDIVKLIDNTDTPEDILDDFVSTFIEETPKWKLEHDSTTH